jgi:hypothetical protein
LDFSEPYYPSAYGSLKDALVIRFNDSAAFRSQQGVTISDEFELEVSVPRQNFGEDLSPVLLETVKQTAVNTARTTIFLSFFRKAIANVLLTHIRNLTFICHLFLIDLRYPMNARKFFAALFPMISFDIFPADEWIFGAEEQPISPIFEDLGYQHVLFHLNLGSMYFVMWFLIAKCCLYVVGSKLFEYLNGLGTLLQKYGPSVFATCPRATRF